MPMAEFQLGEWLPDRPSFRHPGCEVADNVLPIPGGYQPLLGPNQRSGSVSGVVRGATQMFDTPGDSIVVGGTDTTLFTRKGATVVETAGYTSLGAGQYWDFARFNRFVIATSGNNPPQYLSDIDTDTSWSDLPGDPPVAKRCAKVAEFLMMGSVDGVPYRIQWSGLNAPTGDWTKSRRTQANFADLDAQAGEVQRIIGGRYAMVFQERGISRLSYVGAPTIWRADPISKERGAVAPFAVVPLGYLTYFLAQDGFYVTDGSSIQPIGSRRINKWFYDTVQQARLKEVHGAVDWQNKAIVWAFHETSQDNYDRFIIYSWEEDRWTSGTVAVDWLTSATLAGVTLEDLDALYDSDIDTMPVSLDSPEFRNTERRLAAFFDGDYFTFDGLPLRATFETGEVQPEPGRRVFISEARPVMNATDWDAIFHLRIEGNRSQQTVIGPFNTGWSGFAPVRGEGQRIAVRFEKPEGTWSEAQAIQVRYELAGYR